MPVLPPGSATYKVTTSGAKLVSRALRLIGAIDPTEGPKPEELVGGMEALNALLDAWNTERLAVYALNRVEFTLTPDTATYTIGEGGDIDVPRPPKIEAAKVADGDSEYPLEIYTQQRWSFISVTPWSGLPNGLYYDAANPLGNISLDGSIDKAYVLKLDVWNLLAQIADANTLFSLPPGYAEALAYHLAVRLAPEYGKAVTGEVAEVARTSKANLKRVNMQPIEMKCDAALLQTSGFDIHRGY